MLVIQADHRSLRTRPEPDVHDRIVRRLDAYIRSELRFARDFARLEQSSTWAEWGCASVVEYGSRHGYRAAQVHNWATLGKAIQAVPELETLVLEQKVPIEQAEIIAPMLLAPELEGERKEWMDLAGRTSPRRLRSYVSRRLEQVRQGQEDLLAITIWTTRRAKQDWQRACDVVSTKLRRHVSEGEVFAYVVNRFLEKDDPLRRALRIERGQAGSSTAAPDHTPGTNGDARPRSSARRDAGRRDAGRRDAGCRDAGCRDAGCRDAGCPDAVEGDAVERNAVNHGVADHGVAHHGVAHHGAVDGNAVAGDAVVGGADKGHPASGGSPHTTARSAAVWPPLGDTRRSPQTPGRESSAGPAALDGDTTERVPSDTSGPTSPAGSPRTVGDPTNRDRRHGNPTSRDLTTNQAPTAPGLLFETEVPDEEIFEGRVAESPVGGDPGAGEPTDGEPSSTAPTVEDPGRQAAEDVKPNRSRSSALDTHLEPGVRAGSTSSHDESASPGEPDTRDESLPGRAPVPRDEPIPLGNPHTFLNPASRLNRRPRSGSRNEEAHRRYVPAGVRRQIWIRAGGTCEVPGCSGTRDLQLCHIRAWARGGANGRWNLLLLCRRHHLLLDAGRIRFLRWSGDGGPVFRLPDGKVLYPEARAPPGSGRD